MAPFGRHSGVLGDGLGEIVGRFALEPSVELVAGTGRIRVRPDGQSPLIHGLDDNRVPVAWVEPDLVL